jgi:dUTP pyrophosphatase
MEINIISLEIEKVKENATVPNPPKFGDLGIDLFSAETKEIPPLTTGIVTTGLRFKFPLNFGGLIRPRGKDKFLIGSGVIDAGYRGEVLVRVFNASSNTSIVFNPGDSLGQMVLVPVYVIDITEVSDIKTRTERGESGGIWTNG